MKLSTKLTIPAVSVIVIIGLTAGFFVNKVVSDNVNRQIKRAEDTMQQSLELAAQDRINELNNTIKRIGRKALNQAALFTGNSEIIGAYELAHVGTIDDENDAMVQQARAMLRHYFKPLLADYKEFTKSDSFKMHFHLPNARSFVRLWRDGWQVERNGVKVDLSDDLSSFRKTLLKINQQSHEPITGIEVGRSGLFIRGIAPINNDEGSHLGSVEVKYPIANLLKVSKTSELVNFAVYMDSSQLAVATALHDSKKYPVLDGKYVRLNSTNFKLSDSLLTAGLLSQGHEKPFSTEKGHYYLTIFPVKDYFGKTVGVMVSLTDISKQHELIANTKADGEATVNSLQRDIIIAMLVIAVLVIGGLLRFIAATVSKPLSEAVIFCDKLSEGDLTAQLPVKFTQQKGTGDELSLMAKALDSLKQGMKIRAEVVEKIGNGDLTSECQINSENDTLGVSICRMISNLSDLVQNILSSSGKLSQSSVELSQISSHLAARSEDIASQSTTIAGATEEINVNSQNVAETVQEISQSMQGAATDTETMSTSISKIGQNAQEGSRITQSALDKTATATEVITALDLAAREISEVTKVIGDISEQTKLLALNATIEAARAGEAGKGFAVVAGEVKELAHQTSEATNNIAARIGEVQASTQQAVQTISEVTDIVGKVNDSSLHITASVEEQVTVAQEIATAVAQANQGTNSIRAALDELTRGTAEVSTNIQAVNQGTLENTDGITTISKSAEALAGLAKDLDTIMAKFKLKG